jgi:putative acetyltransferase
MDNIMIRPIQPADNAAVAAIIRSSLAEFGVDKPGTVFYDPTTDNLHQLFQEKNSIYYVAELDGKPVGGAGIFPSAGLPADTAELVKMYLKKEVRGLGLGKLLVGRCLSFAEISGYKKVYIETMPELKKALGLYEKFGFTYLNGPMGNTGHFGCELWMLKAFD